MTPLSGIPRIMSAYGVTPQLDALAPGNPAAPGVQAPSPAETSGVSSATAPSGDSFANLLGKMVEDVNAQQNAASAAVNGMQAGQNVSLHQAVIAMEEANVSFQLMVEVRNKLLDSYQELMRMQI